MALQIMLKSLFKKNLPRTFLSKDETAKLAQRVQAFESKTGCELVFHFRRRLGSHPTEFNRKLFSKFKLDQTLSRRGILITLALIDRKFAVWTDTGIADHAGEKFWNTLCQELAKDLKDGTHIQALLNAVMHAEIILHDMKPLKDFKNELPNTPLIEGE
jgi:uncharacterized membrane protein